MLNKLTRMISIYVNLVWLFRPENVMKTIFSQWWLMDICNICQKSNGNLIATLRRFAFDCGELNLLNRDRFIKSRSWIFIHKPLIQIGSP